MRVDGFSDGSCWACSLWLARIRKEMVELPFFLLGGIISTLESKFGGVTHCTGDVLSFLGMRIVKDPVSAEIIIDQPAYVAELTHGIPTEYLPATPVTKDLMDREAFGNSVDQKDFLSRVMKLMYLATKTRPDIRFAVSTLASRSGPRESDLKQFNRVYQYLRGTSDLKVRLKCQNMELSAPVDASFGSRATQG
jgi:hypothetical protein